NPGRCPTIYDQFPLVCGNDRAASLSGRRAFWGALAWTLVPAWACRMEGREAGRACGWGLAYLMGSFSRGAGLWEAMAGAPLLLAENYNRTTTDHTTEPQSARRTHRDSWAKFRGCRLQICNYCEL